MNNTQIKLAIPLVTGSFGSVVPDYHTYKNDNQRYIVIINNVKIYGIELVLKRFLTVIKLWKDIKENNIMKNDMQWILINLVTPVTPVQSRYQINYNIVINLITNIYLFQTKIKNIVKKTFNRGY